MPVVLARTGWSAEVGYEVYLRDARHGEQLWETIMAAGKTYGITPASPSRIRRIEAGILDYRVDMDDRTNPFEVGLDRLVDLHQDADFIGKAALQRIKVRGIDRVLVGVEIAGEPITQTNQFRWPVRLGADAVGELTSSVYSPRLEKNIGYVMVQPSCKTAGTALIIETPDGDVAATVVRMPFVDPDKLLPRQG
jgi:aminomethyltransferase